MEKNLKESIRENSERGASLVEYSLLIALIALTAIGSAQILGENVTLLFDYTSQNLDAGSCQFNCS